MTTAFSENPISHRQELAGDIHRPVFHFLPPNNWMNDPNGLCYFRGRYHLFYQKNPFGPLWGFMHWGHASSPDLIHWQDHPIALAPEDSAGDGLGVFSGCIVDDNGTPTAIYTGVKSIIDTPILAARARDSSLDEWEKIPQNPIIAEKPEGVNSMDFRDPYVWRQDNRWQMVVGAGMSDNDSAVLLYESDDLFSWRYLGPLLKQRSIESVTMWECPNFFPLDDKFVLLVSLYPNTQGIYYYTGNYDGRVFTPESQGYFDSDGILYAPQVRRFPDGRTILFGWLREQRSDEAIEEAGWAGVLSLPRELALDQHGRLVSRPVREYQQLRMPSPKTDHLSLNPGERLILPITGRQVEVGLSVRRGEGSFELGVAASPDETEFTLIGCDPQDGTVLLDTTHSSLSGNVQTGVQMLSLVETDGEEMRLHVLLDGSVIEVWVNETLSLSGRIYPTMADAENLFLRAGNSKVQSLELFAWEMDSIWDF